jgi:hypothetical protein
VIILSTPDDEIMAAVAARRVNLNVGDFAPVLSKASANQMLESRWRCNSTTFFARWLRKQS